MWNGREICWVLGAGEGMMKNIRPRSTSFNETPTLGVYKTGDQESCWKIYVEVSDFSGIDDVFSLSSR